MLPASNAVLTSIARGGFTEDYDQADAADTAAWTGQADCYVVDKVRTFESPQGLNRVKVTYLVVAADIGQLVLSGDTVTYERDAVAYTGTVWELQVAELAGTCRLHLEDSRVLAA